jgi:hypothetical protein
MLNHKSKTVRNPKKYLSLPASLLKEHDETAESVRLAIGCIKCIFRKVLRGFMDFSALPSK